MQPRASPGRPRIVAIALRWAAALGAVGVALQIGAAAAESAIGDIYTCTSGDRVIKSDHEIADCNGVQTRTNRAGVVTLLLTPEQTSLVDKCERDKAELIGKWRTTDRYNKNLLGKYPDIAALRLARDADLASARESAARSEARLAELSKERKRLGLEREFYPNGAPQKLQRLVDDNDALITAQQQSLKTAQEDVSRIGANFDDLEKYMRVLWLGRASPMPSVDCTPEKLFGKAPRR